MKPKCIVFIPVSSTSGIGEYMRSMIIAKALLARCPGSNIHFILNEQVSYLDDCPYEVHLTKGSPTKNSKAVNRVISQLKPDLVMFDASGRGGQFKHAKKVGAKVGFISQHKKKRSRGLKLNRLFYTDIHWVVQPDFCIEPLSWFQKIKLALFNKKTPKNVGVIYSPINQEIKVDCLDKLNLIENDFFIFNAGSGGHKSGQMLCADVYFQAAQQFYQQTHMACIMVFGVNYPGEIPPSSINEQGCSLICLRSLEHEEFLVLLASAKGRVISAGGTILQCIALNQVSVAASVSSDQPKRLASCAKAGLLIESQLDSESLYQKAIHLLSPDVTQGLLLNMSGIHSESALEIVLSDISLLLKDRIR
jgi:hypothetical protein|tara:strand:- start:725 stop:1813 length:1089 start_codon:yes stop_codon:yes gene_type:complete